MKKIIAFFVVLGILLYLAMNSTLIMEQTLKWADQNPKDPGAAEVILRVAVWCDMTGGDRQAMTLYQAVWERYPDQRAFCAQALYETACIISQSAARRNANEYLNKIINDYSDQEKWRVKAVALWDEVNHAL